MNAAIVGRGARWRVKMALGAASALLLAFTGQVAHAAPKTLEPGVLNSPHTLVADSDGNVYVAEWLIGGRVTKLGRYRGEPWTSG